MSSAGTHLVVCKNPQALQHLMNEWFLIGRFSSAGKPMSQGDALVARDTLLEAGYKWGTDFYLKCIGTDERNKE